MEQEHVNARETFDIEGIGEFRAKRGTAIAELAGAASYWERECRRIERNYSRALHKGMIAGLIAGAAIASSIGWALANGFN